MPGLDFIDTDLLADADCRRAVAGMEIVFMCAANSSGAAVIRADPLSHVTPNVIMNAQMLRAAQEAGVRRFVFLSSGAAYPPLQDRPLVETDMFSGDPHPVYFPVGWMKRYTEILCQTYAESAVSPMSTVIVRPSNIYGPFDKFDPALSHVTASIIRRIAAREDPLDLWRDGQAVRDILYVDDFVEGTLRAAQTDERHYVVNICAGEGRSVIRLADKDEVRMAIHQSDRAVRRSAVDDNVLDVSVALSGDAAERGLDKIGSVETGGDD